MAKLVKCKYGDLWIVAKRYKIDAKEIYKMCYEDYWKHRWGNMRIFYRHPPIVAMMICYLKDKPKGVCNVQDRGAPSETGAASEGSEDGSGGNS